jgi:hypothetical protein
MAHTDWYIEGKAYGNCNCDYCRPCQFELLPTRLGNSLPCDLVVVAKSAASS